MGGGDGGRGRPKKPARGRGAKKKDLWGDPDSDSGGEESNGEEKFHPQTDQGLKDGEDEDEESEDYKGSDSDGGAGVDEELGGQAPRRKAQPKKKVTAPDEDENGLWDPLAGLGPRKKRKVGQAPGKGAPAGASGAAGAASGGGGGGGSSSSGVAPSWTSTFGFPEGSAVCLIGLQKAPTLNGQVGTVGAPLDRATGRCQIILRDGTVKSLKQENLREVFTGAIVRIHGLQGAAELNGRIAECGDLDLATGRYLVKLADGKETQKKIKEANLELVRRYIAPVQLLSTQRRAYEWAEELRWFSGGSGAQPPTWAEQLKRLADLGLPAPRLLSAAALASAATSPADEPVSAEKVPVDDEGKLLCRILAVSAERDVCVPADPVGAEVLGRLRAAAKALQAHDPERPTFFLLPQACVKPLGCLRDAATCAWPLFLQLCQGMVCMDTAYRPHKAWCRVEALLVGAAMSKPVYLLSMQGEVVVGGGDGGWLLSDRTDTATVGAPADGQVLPAERRLLEKLAVEVLPEGPRKGAQLTMYRL